MTDNTHLSEAVDGAKQAVVNKARETQQAYAHGEDRPLKGYAYAMGVYATLVGSASVLAAVSGRRLPKSVPLGDFALIALATHKLSRIVAKDAITSPLRAPFTEYEEPAGASELNEGVRGSGWKHAVGELIECPFCLAVWTSTALVGGHVFAPRATRLFATVFSATAVSDFLQLGYDRAKKAVS